MKSFVAIELKMQDDIEGRREVVVIVNGDGGCVKVCR